MASLKLKHVTKEYDNGVVAVKDFCLDVCDKEFIIFVGPSGCGKSTTLRMIAGLEQITSGEIYIDAERMNDVAPKDRDIAMVFQNYSLYPHMSVFDNMAFGLKLRKVAKREIRERVEQAAEILDIKELLERKPGTLSGGQKQRVAMGRAIVRNPKVFLMDEPLSNLDAKLRVQMRTEIIKLHKRLQTTFIFVTHDQTEAMTLGERIVVMRDGNMMQTGTPLQLYNEPQNMFVAGFIGTPQMNFIKVRVAGEDTVRFGEHDIKLPSYERVLKKHVDRQVIMGVRPEDIHIHEIRQSEADKGEEEQERAEKTGDLQTQKERAGMIAASVEVREVLGADAILYMNCQGQHITVRTGVGSAANGVLGIEFDSERIHLFDEDTQDKLSE